MAILSLYDETSGTWVELPALKGSPATISVGTVTSVAPTEAPTITNSGDEYDAVFDFSIPRGVDGISPVRGTDYWTTEDQQQIISDISSKYDFQFTTLINSINNKPSTYILTNKAELDSLLDLDSNTITYNNETKQLNPGDVFLLTALDEPDYWWGEDSEGTKLHELESRQLDTDQFVKNVNMIVLSEDEYTATPAPSADAFYFVYEETTSS